MKKGTGLILGLFAVANGLFAQYGGGGGAPMAAMNSGDISNLTKVRNVNIVYSYADLGVGANLATSNGLVGDPLAPAADFLADTSHYSRSGNECATSLAQW